LIEEGKVLAQIAHPNLVRVLDLQFHEGRPFLVMEHVAGRTLAQYREQVPLTTPQIATLMAKVARAVAAAHRRGVVHQDLKPENILIDEHDEPRVIDFGMARVLNAWDENVEMTGGTAQFMAPEQAAEFLGRRNCVVVDPRRDVFALGAVLYYLLTGSVPFRGANTRERLEAAADCKFDQQLLDRPGVDPTLVRICRKAMSAQAERRYATAGDLAKVFERRARPRKPWLVVACGAALIVGLGLIWRLRPELPRPPAVPERQLLVESIERPSRGANPLTPKAVDEFGKNLPLRTSDLVTFRCQIPVGFQAAAFLVRADGAVELLEADDTAAVPSETAELGPLSGPRRMEVRGPGRKRHDPGLCDAR
jgi:serine/threonine protein kinase